MLIKLFVYVFIVTVVLFVLSTLRRYFKCKNKTLKNCAINVALTPLRVFKLGPFSRGESMMRDIHCSLKYATKKTKLSDFGGTQFIESYSKIMNSPEQLKERYSNLGYISAKIELGMGWVRRLKLIQYLKDSPEIRNVPVRSPVFVMGLPRTGTTFLHRLLSLDPATRAPLTWELLAPVPSADPTSSQESHNADRNKRMKFIKKLLETRKSMGDHALEKIHEIGYDLPEECLLGLCDELPVLIQYFHSGYLNIETILSMDATEAYRYYKTVLQLLSFQVGEKETPRRWTLKCPIHLFYPKEIGTVFPDAKFVWTHRHPRSAVPSLCSLVEAAHSVYYEPEGMNVGALGKKLDGLSQHLLQQAPKDIAASKCDNANVVYDNLIKDPLGVVKDLYKQFEWEFTPEYEKIMVDYLAENKAKRDALKAPGKKQLHDYSPEDYHLTDAQLSEGVYKDYIKKFGVPEN